jgi:hypothetical protein
VQGRLEEQPLSVEIETNCAHCDRPLHITVTSDMTYQVKEKGARPLLFEPNVNWDNFTEPNIIHAY